MKVMVIVKATERSERGEYGPAEEFAEMGLFNEKLLEAGVMLVGEGLTTSRQGKRVAFDDSGATTVIDGPFAETKELVAGFWLIQAKSQDEALEWCRRIPFENDTDEVELRQVSEIPDFPADDVSGEHLRREQEWRDANAKSGGA